MRVCIDVLQLFCICLTFGYVSISAAQSQEFSVRQRPSVKSSSFRKMVSGDVEFSLGTKSFAELNDDSLYSYLNLGANLDFKFSKWVVAHLDSGINFISGRSQTRFESNMLDTGIYFREAVVSLIPMRTLRFKFGIHSQEFLRSELLINTRMGLPGMRQELRFGNKRLGLRVITQQSILTSESLNTDRAEKEELPTLMTQTLEGYWKPFREVQLVGYGSLYAFNDLPSKVAFFGSANGNTTLNEEQEDAIFQYKFQGHLVGGLMQARPRGWNTLFSFGGEMLKNNKAPNSFDEGRKIFVEMQSRFSAVVVQPRFELFYNESDSAPAFYQKWDYGQNNRQGQMAQLSTFFRHWNFALTAKYFKSDVINANPVQDQRDVWQLQVETYRVTF